MFGFNYDENMTTLNHDDDDDDDSFEVNDGEAMEEETDFEPTQAQNKPISNGFILLNNNLPHSFGNDDDLDSYAVVKLNVGGEIFQTTKNTLTNSDFFKSMFEFNCKQMFQVTKDEKGRFFLDRNPILFRFILEFLRTNELSNVGAAKGPNFLLDLKEEAKFFGLEALAKRIDEVIKENACEEFKMIEVGAFDGSKLFKEISDGFDVKTVVSFPGTSSACLSNAFVYLSKKKNKKTGS